MFVISSRIAKDEGGYGTMTVVLESTYTQESIGIIRETLEIEQMLIERPLLDHPTLTSGGGEMAIDLTLWKDCPDPQLKYQWQYIDLDGTISPLEDDEIEWAKKLLRGVQTFKDYVPVIRRRRSYNGSPSGSERCGVISDPPIQSAGVTSYLKTADNFAEDENGNWTRIEEWTGASGGWDTDIYSDSRSKSKAKMANKRGKTK
jgi:hypothetical protein